MSTKSIALTILSGLTLLGVTAPEAPGGMMSMRMAMPTSSPTFRVSTQPMPSFTGFMANPNVGVPMTRPTFQPWWVSQPVGKTNTVLSTMSRTAMMPAATGFPGNGGYSGSGGYPSASYPDSSTMHGGADAMTALSQQLLANQQTALQQQTILRTNIENRRSLFDAWLYERANQPGVEDLREREQELTLQRSRNDPPFTEILSARALNSLLVELQKLEARGTTLATVALEEAALRNINVTATQNGAHFGLLKHDGSLSWPAVLRDLSPSEDTQALRQEIDSLIKEALHQAKFGRTEAGLVTQLQSDVRSLRALLKKNAGVLSPTRYITAKLFLDDLTGAVQVLERDDAANYILGKFTARGNTVQELLRHMTSLGLVFAPAVAGDEAAYLALQRALAETSYRAQLQTTPK